MDAKKIILVFGPPGSGKDTQGKRIGEKLGIPFISTGEILRQEAKKGTDISKKIRATINNGKMISTDLMNRMLASRLQREDTGSGFVLDGYPREKVQLEFLKKQIEEMKREGERVTVAAFYIKVGAEEIKQRLGGRRVCGKCGATYHMRYDPPKEDEICDVCGYPIKQREDDKEEYIDRRLKDFYDKTDPILTYFKKHGQLVEIDGEQDIREVAREIEEKGGKMVPELYDRDNQETYVHHQNTARD